MKAKRHRKILEIITNQNVATQEELAELLKQEGFKITQATISRDIKELALVKVAGEKDHYKYARAESTTVSDARLQFMLKEFVISYDVSENMVVIRTAPGNANAVASALDKSNWPHIIGTIAGDDTILLIIKPKEGTQVIIEQLQHYLA